MTVKQTIASAIVMVLDDVQAKEDEQHAQNVVEAFRKDLKTLGEYNAYILLVKRIAFQRKSARSP